VFDFYLFKIANLKSLESCTEKTILLKYLKY